jgi:hypothetical protein
VTSRYFKFTDGKRTYFRASTCRIYRAGWSAPDGVSGFLTQDAELGQFPTVEIDGKEFRALQVAKRKRLVAAGWPYLKLAAPMDSWIWNRDLPTALAGFARSPHQQQHEDADARAQPHMHSF